MGLRDIGAALPPGFRFYPSDEELVCHYLYKKIMNEEVMKGTLVEINLHTCEPWQLPEVAKLNANEWYFFSFRDRKYATGFRTNRAATSGYWKATGKDRTVTDSTSGDVVGMRKTLVFYRNRAPNGTKTGWIMHEFRLETPHTPPKEDWALCRVFHKSKGVNSTGGYPQFLFEATTSTAANNNNINLVSSPVNDRVVIPLTGSNINQPINSSLSNATHYNHDRSSFLNLLQLSRGKNMTTNDYVINGGYGISSKADIDDYGYLWEDMNLEETSMGAGEASNLEDMRLYVDNNFNSNDSTVYI